MSFVQTIACACAQRARDRAPERRDLLPRVAPRHAAPRRRLVPREGGPLVHPFLPLACAARSPRDGTDRSLGLWRTWCGARGHVRCIQRLTPAGCQHACLLQSDSHVAALWALRGWVVTPPAGPPRARDGPAHAPAHVRRGDMSAAIETSTPVDVSRMICGRQILRGALGGASRVVPRTTCGVGVNTFGCATATRATRHDSRQCGAATMHYAIRYRSLDSIALST
jgi:hypothetical protein